MSRPVALVTGGSRGIGLGIARRLASDGYDLVINGRRPQADVQPVIDELTSLGVDVLYVAADIASLDDHERLVQAIDERFGRLDALINNAGVAPNERADIREATAESFDRLISINLRGPYFLTQRVANWMIQQKQADDTRTPSITFVTSISSTVVSVNRGDYCLSKAALSMAAQLWAARLGEFGIPCYEVRPGIIQTDMTSGVTEKYDKLFAEGIAIDRRWGKPEDVGSVVAALVRGDLPYATGQAIMVDGGLTTQRL
ncbi:3-ketoacyl-ACP reductase [Mucisphaera calidilacus]|uniref:3-oxoacyl-[acyl-carrier-protein] reductase FabG n=1 Tax=Mucisphaera calidilacus TaxID=2527982 RepID=A0A518C0A8_9BACT|nr:3-ketoacyl-ACP reductase [Mucisphaera calidilacus]QDU72656.1 3-oxoacyl-[acyl-carrier-protein] reductase FabG [Mucisphaera calidilacus]